VTGEAFAQTVHAALNALGVEAGTMVGAQATFAPDGHETATEALRALRHGQSASSLAVELGEPLGLGGMGIVHLAQQVRMGREVAVKSVRPEKRSERATVELLQEAWVTGRLEHPNIVPVYDVALREDGDPVVILKRLEGETWSELLRDESIVRERYSADDPLAFHLQVLGQVCNAVRFAHARGIVHRDIKPDNVQVGPFGEVYLLDWGIAVSTVDDGSRRLPLASESKGIAGTPAYMAPDMLGVYDEPVDHRADVYLLGATLYEIITGHPPHEQSAWGALVRSMLLSELSFPEDAPPGLVTLVQRATDPDRDVRLQSAEAFRLELEHYGEQRDAERLAARATSRRGDLDEAVGAKDAAAATHREAIYRIFGECRFGFRSALELWPDCEAAQDGLSAATETMIRYELSVGQAEAAQGWLGQLDAPPGELEAEVKEALAGARAERERLANLESDIDPSLGRRTRLVVGIICGSIWVAIPFAVGQWGDSPDPKMGVYSALVSLVLVVALFAWGRESMTRTRINRNLSLSVLAAILALLVTHLMAWAQGGTMRDALVEVHLAWTCITGLSAITAERRLVLSAVGFLAGYVWLSLDPDANAALVSAMTNGLLLVVIVAIWARPREDLAVLRGLTSRTPPE